AVVASRSPGLVDSVRDGETGLLVPHGDVAALAAAIEGVLADPALRARLELEGRRWAAGFTWERCAEEAYAVLEGTLGAALARRPGTPLYVLIGRIFGMLPFGNVALQINWISSLATAIAVLFTFLVTVRLMRLSQKGERTTTDEIIAWTAGAVAAFFVAFSNT